ncbi:flagellar biosynthetic protein FliO [Geomesophilobacter sediminis]|uniref:Flagellar protein n=1 Tax=Geomesophilobacter sediminis TaxID=2798584 RepID=A0A8J7IQ95_9BACT|nr:flagellar biosynthetic protein FliO [Geomesophilobacter sediminis]MBJ6724759.1 flagellar biosynthetic protein FliO [Geomesophilobacter sediminis]
MRKTLLAGVLCGLPATARAAGNAGPDVGASVVQVFGSLVLVVGIILVLYYLAQRYLKLPQSGSSRYIRVVETRYLAPKKSLVLVEVGGEYLLLSNSGEGVNLIAKVDMLEEIEVVEEPPQIAVQLSQRLKSLAGARRRFLRRNSGGI